ncbi:hypothetical protein [Pseudomonas aeruginosa]|uniref:hypothetical protein n=1 Tax=Pseudomonas aeruginosa TaxID=287 RepID=UPI000FF81FAB|nr:hypothetical protein [Pseudomonas aeruginosa]MDI3622698.1 hypothetical protein [Pseudomonas aeruginosa]MDY1058839.1 hypothetical protein [Pseudomonas aeruginosa]QGQ06724.1 hypothetical protein FDK04_30490 [Pseudomonas aeruginosa]RPP92213.1 hypothetical protein IPC1124_28540 [Pseudomonas aeruginosa]RPQ02465.1 hypothetical protein IPC1112_29210 [Pseudomonas aeruginosa]
MSAVRNKPQSSALKAPISQLPPRRFAAITPTTTVEEALSEAIGLTGSVSSILGALNTSDEERVPMYALEIAAELVGDLVDAALDALRKEGQQ